MVYFVGAGAGDPELLTLKGKRLIDHADTLIYAGSLVNPEVLAGRKPSSKVYDSAGMTLEEVLAVMKETEQAGGTTVRVHTGDASIYGAIWESLMKSYRASALFWRLRLPCRKNTPCRK